MSALCEVAHSYRAAGVTDQLPIAVLVSGTGTNLQALLDTVHGREAQIVAVASSAADAPALRRAQERGVPTAVFARADHSDRHARDEALADWLSDRGARLVVLAGYMELLGEPFLARFEGGERAIRFDVIAVLDAPAGPIVRHVPNAFDAGY